MTYKRRLMRKNNATNIYITIRVMKIYRSIKNQKKHKENYERSKMSDIHEAVSKTRYEKKMKIMSIR
jgi:hypothetical protein